MVAAANAGRPYDTKESPRCAATARDKGTTPRSRFAFLSPPAHTPGRGPVFFFRIQQAYRRTGAHPRARSLSIELLCRALASDGREWDNLCEPSTVRPLARGPRVLVGWKAPAVEKFAWLPVGAVSTKTGRGSVSLI